MHDSHLELLIAARREMRRDSASRLLDLTSTLRRSINLRPSPTETSSSLCSARQSPSGNLRCSL